MLKENMFLYFSPIDQNTVEQMLLSIPDDKSCGFDPLDGKLLKTVANQLAQSICHIFNRCLLSGVYPNLWKTNLKLYHYLKREKLTSQNLDHTN